MGKPLAAFVVAVMILGLAALVPSTAQAALRDWDEPPVNISETPQEARGAQVVTDGATITAIWYGLDGDFNNPGDYRIQTAYSTDAGLSWSFPRSLSAAGASATDPQLVTDGTTITAIWSRFEVRGSANVIQASSSRDGGATWSRPTIVSNLGESAFNPKLVTAGTTITAVWVAGSRVRTASSIDGGIRWSIPAPVSEVGQNANGPQLVGDGARVTAVWNRSDGSNQRIQSAYSIDHGLTWSTPTTLSAATRDAVQAQLVTDGARVTVVWKRFDGTEDRIQARSSSDGGATWTAPATLSAPGTDPSRPQTADRPQIVTNGTTITVVWVQADVIQASSSVNGGSTWSPPTNLFPASVFGSGNPELVTDGTTITAAWVSNDGATVWMQIASSTNGGATWSPPVRVSDDDPSGAPPQLATDGNTITAVWMLHDNQDFRIQTSSFTADPIVSRLSGADRYETAVAISNEFDPGVPVVYLATGTNYPDALSAASAAAVQLGPLLLTTPDSLPEVVRNELVRLDPGLVVIVGGEGVVSAAVESQVRSALPPPVTVRRDAGDNRYETSRIIAERGNFPRTRGGDLFAAFIATGRNFPDALSASAAAGVEGAPVILVDGNALGLDSATQTLLLNTFGVQQVVIAGGTGVVSAGIEDALGLIVGPAKVTRLSGIDRYMTSVEINKARFAEAPAVFLASGLGFADALAGAALAGNVNVRTPLYVVPGTCVPAPVLAEIDRLKTVKVVLFGGTGVLTSDVFNLVSC